MAQHYTPTMNVHSYGIHNPSKAILDFKIGEKVMKGCKQMFYNEKFENDKDFKYYINGSTVLQIQDNHYNTIKVPDKGLFAIFNYDLYSKESPDKIMYGIMRERAGSWELGGFKTADVVNAIARESGITSYQLPVSSRQARNIQKDSYKDMASYVSDEFIDNTEWELVPQNKITQENVMRMVMTEEKRILRLKESLKDDKLPYIPIMSINDKYGVYGVKMVHESPMVYYGVLFRYYDDTIITMLICGWFRQSMMNVRYSPRDLCSIVAVYYPNIMPYGRDFNFDDVRAGNRLLGASSHLVTSDGDIKMYRPMTYEELGMNEEGGYELVLPNW